MHCTLNKCSIHTNTQLTCKRIFLLFVLQRSTFYTDIFICIEVNVVTCHSVCIFSIWPTSSDLPLPILFFKKKYLEAPFIYAYIKYYECFFFGWPFDHLYRIHFPFPIQTKFLVMVVVLFFILLLSFFLPFVIYLTFF